MSLLSHLPGSCFRVALWFGLAAFFLSLSMAPLAFGQNSLSRSTKTSAKALLDDSKNDNESFLNDGYYQQFSDDEELYAVIPEDIRQIFARIRFLSLSLETVSAADQVLNALARGYLLYNIEAAAYAEAQKIMQPRWQARTLIDIADYHFMREETDRAKAALDQSYNILAGIKTDQQEEQAAITQYYFDVSSRLALLGYYDESIRTLNSITNNDFVQQTQGFLLVAERAANGVATNVLLSTERDDLSERIRACRPEKLFVRPSDTLEQRRPADPAKDDQEHSQAELIFIDQAYELFRDYRQNNGLKADPRIMKVLLLLQERLSKIGRDGEAKQVLYAIRDTFLPQSLAISKEEMRQYAIPFADTQDAKTTLFDASNWRSSDPVTGITQTEAEIEYVRNLLINAFISTGDVQSGMELTRNLDNPIKTAMAYISAGIAHNNGDSSDVSTALFNYAQDIAVLIDDTRARDFVLNEVVGGQARAGLYNNAFRNAALILRDQLRYKSLYKMAESMLRNGDFSSANFLVDYLAPTDLRVRLLANLGYLRSNLPPSFFKKFANVPEPGEFFASIIDIFNDPYLDGQLLSLNTENAAILHAMCANATRQDLRDFSLDGQLLGSEDQEKSDRVMRDAAVHYTALINNIYDRAEAFSTIAELVLEQGYADEAQTFLDTAWNLTWSVREVSRELTDPIFLQIVRGKIISAQIIDAYNVATGMSEATHLEQEISRNPLTGDTEFSDRIQGLMDFSRYAMVAGEYGIALRAIEDIGIGQAKSQAMANAISDLIIADREFNFDNALVTSQN